MKVTREDVKAQLAKNPLEWTSSKDPSDGKDVHTATIPINIDPNGEYNYVIENRVQKADGVGDLEISNRDTGRLDGEQYCDIFFVSNDVPDAKKLSEEHRLNLVCSLLGIKE